MRSLQRPQLAPSSVELPLNRRTTVAREPMLRKELAHFHRRPNSHIIIARLRVMQLLPHRIFEARYSGVHAESPCSNAACDAAPESALPLLCLCSLPNCRRLVLIGCMSTVSRRSAALSCVTPSFRETEAVSTSRHNTAVRPCRCQHTHTTPGQHVPATKRVWGPLSQKFPDVHGRRTAHLVAAAASRRTLM